MSKAAVFQQAKLVMAVNAFNKDTGALASAVKAIVKAGLAINRFM